MHAKQVQVTRIPVITLEYNFDHCEQGATEAGEGEDGAVGEGQGEEGQ